MNTRESGNPVLRKDVFRGLLIEGEAMTFQGSINKTILLSVLLIGAAIFTWTRTMDNLTQGSMPIYMWGGAIGGLIVALVISFQPKWASYLAPLYAVLEGLFLGGISAFFEMAYQGIVFQVVLATFSVFAVLLLVYKSGMIQVSQKFKMIVVGATMGIALLYLAGWVLGMFGVQLSLFSGTGIFGIGFSLVVVVIASLNLVLDFDFIRKASEQGAPKYMEWYAGFSLMVTLVWLYMEILRLLSKLRSR